MCFTSKPKVPKVPDPPAPQAPLEESAEDLSSLVLGSTKQSKEDAGKPVGRNSLKINLGSLPSTSGLNLG